MNRDKIQENWHELVKRTRSDSYLEQDSKEEEAPASKELAALLRAYADQVESQKWPLVFGYYEAKEGPFWHINVVLSHPWGG